MNGYAFFIIIRDQLRYDALRQLGEALKKAGQKADERGALWLTNTVGRLRVRTRINPEVLR